MVRKEIIDRCQICKVEIDNSYKIPRKICKKPECLKERRRLNSESNTKRLRKEHKCLRCFKPVKLDKLKNTYPSRCIDCKKSLRVGIKSKEKKHG